LKYFYKPILFFLLVSLSGGEWVFAQLTFQRTFQAPGMNGGLSLSLTTDGGYVVTGQHESSGGGACDVYVYKRDACGNTDFFNSYGDAFSQGGVSVKQTADGGFIVAGLTQPTNRQELILMKLDAAGNMQWVQNYGNGTDWPMYVQQTTDGGFIVTGGTVTPVPYTWDVLLMKTDAAGNIQWSRTFMTPGEDMGTYVEQTTDGGYFISGYSQGSVNTDADVVAIKTDISGNVQWANVYGGTNHDGNGRYDGLSLFATSGQQTTDGGYAIATSSRSFSANDSVDIWLLKLDPSGAVQWNKTYGGNDNEEARELRVTFSGGYAIMGWTMSYGLGEQDVLLLNLDSLGNVIWAKTYGGALRDKGESLTQSSIDKGFYIDGYSASFTPNFAVDLFDAYALKTDSFGVTGCNETTPTPAVANGTPYVMPYPYTPGVYPALTPAVFAQAAYNPGEYALCETLPPPDVAQFTNNTVCVGDSTVFTDFSTAGFGFVTEWYWDFGDGSPIDSTQNPVHTYSAAGTYSVSLVIHTTYSCIPDSTVQLVIVNPLPVPLFAAPIVCFTNQTNFTDLSTTATGTLTQWSWNFGDGNTSGSQSPGYTYSTPGTFTVTLIVTNSFGCIDTFQQTVVVNPLPIANFSSTTVCLGNQTCFSDSTTISSGSITGWGWNFDDPGSGANNISNVQNPCHTYTASGTFNITLTATSDSGCQSTTILPAVVLPLPVAAFTAPNVCLNTATVFSDGSTGASQWSWDFGDGNNSTAQNPSHTYLAYGTYVVTQIVTSPGNCKDTITDTITVHPIPIVNFSNDTVCVGYTTSFVDLSFIPAGNITNWLWDFGDGSTSSQQNPTHAFSTSGMHNVTLTLTSNNNCTNTISIPVLVRPLPLAEFSYVPGPTVTLLDQVEFTDLSQGGSFGNIVSWDWNLGDGTTDTIQNPWHIYGDTGTYIITLIVVSEWGCVDTIVHPLRILDFAFYIPNAFTPNADGANEFFFGKGIGITEYEMYIFDRWGNLIFNCHINDLPQSQPCWWDGKVRGGNSSALSQEDVYVWKVHFTSVFKKQYTYIGTVTIVK